jgi:Porin PorA
MRGRAIGLGLLAVGAFLLAAALAVRLFLEPALVKYPLDQTASPTADGTDVDFFDLTAGEQLTGLEADVRQEVVGDPGSEAANDDVAVWNFGSTVTSTDDVLLNAGTYRVCIDRREAVAVECDVDHVDYDDDVNVEGLTLTFPFGTEQQDYDVFNSTTKQAWPATYEGTEELNGLEVYRFQLSIPETVIRELDAPAAFFGSAATGSVPAEVVYSNERTIWVEPVSGVIVTSEERPETVMRGPDGEAGPTILAGTFAGDEDTIADGVDRAEDIRSQITLVSTVLPLSLAGLGLVLLIVGALLVRRARGVRGAHRDESYPATTEIREPQVQ